MAINLRRREKGLTSPCRKETNAAEGGGGISSVPAPQTDNTAWLECGTDRRRSNVDR